jgi:hypothetical protein
LVFWEAQRISRLTRLYPRRLPMVRSWLDVNPWLFSRRYFPLIFLRFEALSDALRGVDFGGLSWGLHGWGPAVRASDAQIGNGVHEKSFLGFFPKIAGDLGEAGASSILPLYFPVLGLG